MTQHRQPGVAPEQVRKDALKARVALAAAVQELERDADNCRNIARIYYGYAPGHYQNKCIRCDKVFELSDKRAKLCIECADAAIAARELGPT
jgi:hypothetical protein